VKLRPTGGETYSRASNAKIVISYLNLIKINGKFLFHKCVSKNDFEKSPTGTIKNDLK
jgi:hypothetical protein